MTILFLGAEPVLMTADPDHNFTIVTDATDDKFDTDYSRSALLAAEFNAGDSAPVIDSVTPTVGQELWFHARISPRDAAHSNHSLSSFINLGDGYGFTVLARGGEEASLSALKNNSVAAHSATVSYPSDVPVDVDIHIRVVGTETVGTFYIDGVEQASSVLPDNKVDYTFQGIFTETPQISRAGNPSYVSEMFVRAGPEPTTGMRMKTLVLSGDSAPAEWTGSHTDINGPETTVGSLSTDTADEEHLFTLDDVSVALAGEEVENVVLGGSFSRTGDDASDIEIRVKTGGTTYATDVNTDDAGTMKHSFVEHAVNPNTSAAWTLTDLDALELGVRSKT